MSRCVIPSVLTVYSVRQVVSPGVHPSNLGFVLYVLCRCCSFGHFHHFPLVRWCHSVPVFASAPKHLTVAEPQSDVALKVSKCLEWSWPNSRCCVVCVSTAVVFCPRGPCSTVLPPSADCFYLNSLSSDIMTLFKRPAESLLWGRWKCLRAFHFRAKHDCLHTLWQTSWQKKKKTFLLLFLFLCVLLQV